MKQLRTALWIGGVGVAYWLAFYAFVFQDLYLDYAGLAMVVKVLAPLVLVAELFGAALAVVSWRRGGGLAVIAIAMNLVPVIGAVVFVLWLFLGVPL